MIQERMRAAREHKRRVDPILNADIYIPLEPGAQKRVSERVSVINDAVTSYKRECRFIPCPYAYTRPDDTAYQHYLDVYEANQNYYLEHRSDYNDEDFCNAVRELENWFVRIAEPCILKVDHDGWMLRENKRMKGVSHYCDETIRSVLLTREKGKSKGR